MQHALIECEQVPMIGTMKALGGQRGTIMRGYLISMSIYACVGTVFGIALGSVIGIVHDLNKDLGNTLGVAYTNIQVLNVLDHAPATLHSDLTVSDLMVRARDRSPAAVNTLTKDLYAVLAHNGTQPRLPPFSSPFSRIRGQASQSGHYIQLEQPDLVIDALSKTGALP